MKLSRPTRKSGIVPIREPNGRLHRSVLLDEACSPNEVKRLRDAALGGMREPEWGTELGRLFLEGKLSASLYATGKWWAVLATKARLAIDAPKQAPTMAAFIPKQGGHPPDPDSDRGRRQVAKDRQACLDFMQAHGALIGAGMLAERAVRSVCEDNKTIDGYAQLGRLQTGLRWLNEYRDLTNRARNVR